MNVFFYQMLFLILLCNAVVLLLFMKRNQKYYQNSSKLEIFNELIKIIFGYAKSLLSSFIMLSKKTILSIK